MEAALNQLRADGFEVRDEDVARLSPLLHEHINMLGRYSFSVPHTVAKGELRPCQPGEQGVDRPAGIRQEILEGNGRRSP